MGIYSLPKCNNYIYKVISTLFIKKLCRHFFYGARCRFNHVPGIDLTCKYTTDLATFMKLAVALHHDITMTS